MKKKEVFFKIIILSPNAVHFEQNLINVKTCNETLLSFKPRHKSTAFHRIVFVSDVLSLSVIVGCKTVPILSIDFFGFWLEAKKSFCLFFFFFYGSLPCAEILHILCCNLNPDVLAQNCVPQSSGEKGTMRHLCSTCCAWKGVVLGW